MPLAFAALPLYVHWPAHMAAQPGWNLAALGGLLLAVRVIDAALDPGSASAWTAWANAATTGCRASASAAQR